MAFFTYHKDYIPSRIDEYLNFGLDEYFDIDDCYNILFCARSWAGKGVLINNLFINDIIHWTKISNIIIFSPTFRDDKSFSALRNFMYKGLKKEQIDNQIFDTLNLEKLTQILNK